MVRIGAPDGQSGAMEVVPELGAVLSESGGRVRVVATVPILAAYPFAQKYFIRGIMVGSLKG